MHTRPMRSTRYGRCGDSFASRSHGSTTDDESSSHWVYCEVRLGQCSVAERVANLTQSDGERPSRLERSRGSGFATTVPCGVRYCSKGNPAPFAARRICEAVWATFGDRANPSLSNHRPGRARRWSCRGQLDRSFSDCERPHQDPCARGSTVSHRRPRRGKTQTTVMFRLARARSLRACSQELEISRRETARDAHDARSWNCGRMARRTKDGGIGCLDRSCRWQER